MRDPDERVSRSGFAPTADKPLDIEAIAAEAAECANTHKHLIPLVCKLRLHVPALIAALRAERARADRLERALEDLMTDPHGCRLCDYGVSRRDRQHFDDCAWVQARAALAQEPVAPETVEPCSGEETPIGDCPRHRPAAPSEPSDLAWDHIKLESEKK